MKGFELLSTATKTDSDFAKKFAEQTGVQLPPFYSRFLNCFNLGQRCFDNSRCWHSGWNDSLALGTIIYDNLTRGREIPIDIFFDKETIVEKWKDNLDTVEYDDYGLMQIASIDIGGGLYVCIHGDELDGIFLSVWDWEDTPLKIEKDIFSFVKNIKLKEYDLNFDYLLINSFDQIHRKWGDKYWTVQGNNNSTV